MDYFKRLPHEITLEILSRVPSESVLECKLVCKSWRNTVSYNPLFPQLHLDHLNRGSAAEDDGKMGFLALAESGFLYFIEYNENEKYELGGIPVDSIRDLITIPPKGACFVGSGNGLICLALNGPEKRPVFISNPFTKQYALLPEISVDNSDDYNKYSFWSFGFGYLPSTNEYKVVAIHVPGNIKFIQVHIYTLGSGKGWRNLGKFDSKFLPEHEHGRFANGAIYWVGATEMNTILNFDLLEEKFCEHLAVPTSFPPDTDLQGQTVGVMDGFLYIAVFDVGDECFDIWLLKKKNDKKEGEEHQSLGWCKEFRVKQNELLAVTKSGGVLTYSCGEESENCLNIYDTKAFTSATLLDFVESVLRVFPHRNTFVSLKQLGESVAGDRKP